MSENDVWTIKAALDWTVGYLGRKGDANPRLSAEWLLAEACGMRRIELYVNFERPLSAGERDVLRGYVSRRGRGEPLQYITGEVAFRHIAVKVRPGVLIPRPETEVLVSEALSLLPAPERARALDSRLTEEEASALAARAKDRPEEDSAGEKGRLQKNRLRKDRLRKERLLVADICTGSGCIACSVAYEHPAAYVVATDIAPEAVVLARENVSALGLDERVRVFEGDLGACVPQELVGAFDLVVSNPPYVPTAQLAEIPREVADFEPALALDGGTDGLDVFRRLLAWCARALKPGGAFAIELHETCPDAAAALAAEAGFANVRITDDLANRPRVLTATRP